MSEPRLTPQLGLVDPSNPRIIFFYLELKVALDSNITAWEIVCRFISLHTQLMKPFQITPRSMIM